MSAERKTFRSALRVVLALLSLIAHHSSFSASAAAAPPLAPAQGVQTTPEIVHLGKVLFFDRRLSSNGTIACADCHQPARGFSDPFPVALGLTLADRTRPAGTRRSPTIINVAYAPLLFRDGRTSGNVTLEGHRFPVGTSALANQALLPLENPLEMGQQTVGQVVARLRQIPGYRRLFSEAFGPGADNQSPIDRNRLGVAIAQFEMTVLSFGAPIDDRLAGNVKALSTKAEIGLALMQKARCFACHAEPHFTTFGFANNGMLFASHPGEGFGQLDQGRAGVSGREQDRRKFKIPTLREVARRAPYGVDGRLPNLSAVVRHYNRGGVRPDGSGPSAGTRDPRMSQLIQLQGWSAEQAECVEVCLREAFASPNYPLVEKPKLP